MAFFVNFIVTLFYITPSVKCIFQAFWQACGYGPGVSVSVYTVEYTFRIKVSLLVSPGIRAINLCGGMFDLSYGRLYLHILHLFSPGIH